VGESKEHPFFIKEKAKKLQVLARKTRLGELINVVLVV